MECQIGEIRKPFPTLINILNNLIEQMCIEIDYAIESGRGHCALSFTYLTLVL